MNKRKLGSFALCVMLIALGFPAEAQQPKKVSRIGYYRLVDPEILSPPAQSQFGWGFARTGLHRRTEHRYRVPRWGGEARWAPWACEPDLVRLKVDIIVVAGGKLWVLAAKSATKTIPIVMVGAWDLILLNLA